MSQLANVAVKGYLLKNPITWFFMAIGLFFSFLIFVIVLFLMSISNQDQNNQATQSYDSSIGGTASVSPAVLRWEPIIQKYASQDGVLQEVPVIMALIQQESGGNSLDVMQSSESIGLPPNTITDPVYSIQIGVEYFANLLKQAKGDVKLTLQSYNFGSGFIPYALTHGGYSKLVAISFSSMMAAKNGLSSYGDPDYVDHVMHYLNTTPTTGQNSSVQVQKLLTMAQSYLSMKTTYVFGAGRNNFDIAAGVFDCSSWVREVFFQAGIDLGPMESTTTDTLAQQGTAVPSKADLKPGDLVFWNTYTFDGHVGIYLGNGQALACNTGKGVSLINMDDSYYAPILSTMRRIIN